MELAFESWGQWGKDEETFRSFNIPWTNPSRLIITSRLIPFNLKVTPLRARPSQWIQVTDSNNGSHVPKHNGNVNNQTILKGKKQTHCGYSGTLTNLRFPESSVSNIIPNLIPTESWEPHIALRYFGRGITNSAGHALKTKTPISSCLGMTEDVFRMV